MYNDLNDYEVMYMVCSRDEDASYVLFVKYSHLVTKICNQYIGYCNILGISYDDMVQEGYLGLYRAIHNYREDKGVLFYTFASVCINRSVLTYIKRYNSYRNISLNEAVSLEGDYENFLDMAGCENEPDEYLEYMILYEDLVNFKHLLAMEDSCVFEMKLNGFSYYEISILLDISKKKVDNILVKSRRKLRKFLLQQ